MKTTLFMFLFSHSILALNLECTVLDYKSLNSPKKFQLKEIRGEQRGKIIGMYKLGTKKLRKSPVYGELLLDQTTQQTSLIFSSDKNYKVNRYTEPAYYIEITFGSETEGLIEIYGVHSPIECDQLL